MGRGCFAASRRLDYQVVPPRYGDAHQIIPGKEPVSGAAYRLPSKDSQQSARRSIPVAATLVEIDNEHPVGGTPLRDKRRQPW